MARQRQAACCLACQAPLDEWQADLQVGGGVAHFRLEPGSNPACRHAAAAPPLRPESAHPELPRRPLAGISLLRHGRSRPGRARVRGGGERAVLAVAGDQLSAQPAAWPMRWHRSRRGLIGRMETARPQPGSRACAPKRCCSPDRRPARRGVMLPPRLRCRSWTFSQHLANPQRTRGEQANPRRAANRIRCVRPAAAPSPDLQFTPRKG
jgi:hypothetical protein